MDQTPQVDHLAAEIESMTGIISDRSPASWRTYPALAFSSSSVASSIITLIALILPFLLLWAIKRYRKMQEKNRGPFPFMELPQELRDMVYENLIENPVYPPPPPCPKHTSAIDYLLPRRWSSICPSSQHPKRSNLVLLANKQIYNEYMDVLCKRATFHLTVSPQTYQNPCTPPTPNTPSIERVWKIAPSTLKQLRSCEFKLIATSSMLGVSDPRNMTSSEWTLAHHIREQLSSLTNVSNITLDAKALGDPLWNPLWIWYHACQSFKDMGTELSDTGPRLNKITFSLDTWSPGENYMERDMGNKGQWTWYCEKSHNVGVDCGVDITVREFCGKLYQECMVCRGESGEEED